ncbi:MAG TPA: hypothetical protein VIV12_23550 [Streptosporangiaceae bacterium]
MNLDILDGTWTWVWQEPPEQIRFCRGLIVRAANGDSTRNPQGFDFLANYERWQAAFSGPLIAWTYLYQGSTPELAARLLALSDAVAYIIDWEDAAGPAPSGAQLFACVEEIRRLKPGVPIGFSSYPTRAQAMAHGVDWDLGIQVCDFVAPQMYYGYQIADYLEVLDDAKGRYVQLDLSPAASNAWSLDIGKHLEGGRGVSFWRLGILGAVVRNQIAGFTQEGVLSEQTIIEAVNKHADDLFRYGDHGDTTVGHGNSRVELRADIRALGGTVDVVNNKLVALAAAIDALAAKVGPAPGGGQVSGTFTATLDGGQQS